MLAVLIQKWCCKTTQTLFILLMLFCNSSVYGDSTAACQQIAKDIDWSPVEKWVWEKICTGETANLDEYEGNQQRVPITKKMGPISDENKDTGLLLCKVHITDYGKKDGNENETDQEDDKAKNKDTYVLNPDLNVWGEHREISPKFLKDILLNESLASNIQSSGIEIKGAYFKERIKLQNAQIKFPLKLEFSFFASIVNLNSINVKDTLSFDNSYF